ncbi:hypothetical protein PanWU01x14_136330 [Parasponia andersonii]|uniref:Uncharacterized protein n=1 Tax=Parasponia andersonii TaxID=3476 RepID=A0A2P5CNW1_PARAD|nr:hypothetical protein PanWU01x14_136330 [Parasponia andersonii]
MIINMGLSKKLRRRVKISELHADKAALWCLNETKKKRMLRYEFYRLHKTRSVKVADWSQKEAWKEQRIAGRNRYVGVTGAPLQWWNKHVFKVIGYKLGGLLDVA